MSADSSPEKVTLRDGSQVVIRPLETDRAHLLLEFYRSLPEEDRLYLRDDVTKPEWLDRFVRRVQSGEIISIVAECNGAIVGEATLYRSLHGWTTHVGEVRVTVAPSHRRKALGHALCREVVRLATGRGVEKLIAQIMENQVAARRMFDHLGFLQEAVLRDHVKDIRGHKRDLLIMANDVSHIWHAMEAMLADYSPTVG
jgi:L-amino acid N-acyltransferase YncA